MLVQVLALAILVFVLWTVFRFAMGLRWAKVSREDSRAAEQAQGRRVLAELPVAEDEIVFFLEDEAGFYWGRRQARARLTAAPVESRLVLEEEDDLVLRDGELGQHPASLRLFRGARVLPGDLRPAQAHGEAEDRPQDEHEDGEGQDLDEHGAGRILMRAALFDFDGVLVDSERLHFRAQHDALVP